MTEFIVKFKEYQFLLYASTRAELEQKICLKLVMKHCQNDSLCELFKSENLILEKFHEKFSEYFELDPDTMPLEGVIRASIIG